jgi:hypothetical protein
MAAMGAPADRFGLLLSHHPPDQYDRCLRVGRHHVCRRCAVLYPLAFAVAVASLAGLHWPEAWDRTLMYLLPLPVTLEFVVERLGGIRYHAGRQMLATLLAAPALGRGFARYIAHPSDRLFWSMVVLFGGTALIALVLTAGRGGAPDQS